MSLPQTQHQRGSRFAPFHVWTAMRLLWFAGLLMIPGAVIWLFSGGVGDHLFASGPFWMFIIGVMLAASGGRGSAMSFRGLISPACDAIGRILASPDCPNCGQSCFDSSPASGYAPETAKQHWWPLRQCAGCGRDLARAAER